MKKIIAFLLAIIFILPLIAEAKSSHRVRGHVTKKGTYVTPHRRTDPDKSKFNNWSSKTNVNPYTGKKGTKDPYKPTVKRSKKY